MPRRLWAVFTGSLVFAVLLHSLRMGFLEILLALSSVQAVPDRQQVASSPSLNAFYANPGRGRGDACQLAPGSASAVPSFGGQAAMNTSRDSVVAVEVVDKLCSSNSGSASAGQDARRMPTATSGLNLTEFTAVAVDGTLSFTSGSDTCVPAGEGLYAAASAHNASAFPVAVVRGYPSATTGSASAVPAYGSTTSLLAPHSVSARGVGTGGPSFPASADDSSGQWISGSMPDNYTFDAQEGVEDDEEVDDSSEIDSQLRIPGKLYAALDLGAEVTSRYFAEGVTA